jgi:hypothetical protein
MPLLLKSKRCKAWLLLIASPKASAPARASAKAQLVKAGHDMVEMSAFCTYQSIFSYRSHPFLTPQSFGDASRHLELLICWGSVEKMKTVGITIGVSRLLHKLLDRLLHLQTPKAH